MNRHQAGTEGGSQNSLPPSEHVAESPGRTKSPGLDALSSSQSTQPITVTTGSFMTPPADHPADDAVDTESIASTATTPSLILRSKFDELDARWSLQRSSSKKRRPSETPSRANDVTTPSRAATTNHAAAETTIRGWSSSPPIQIIGTPENHVSSKGGERKATVFDRLYSHGKAKMTRSARLAARNSQANRRRTTASSLMSPSRLSVGGTTISTLSSTESVFDRLYRNEQHKKKLGRRPTQTTRKSSFQQQQQHQWDDTASASASLERRLMYAPPTAVAAARSQNRIAASAVVGSTHVTRKKKLLAESRSIQSKSAASSSNTVFDRLYRNEKRTTSSLIQRKKRAPSRALSKQERLVHLRRQACARRIQRQVREYLGRLTTKQQRLAHFKRQYYARKIQRWVKKYLGRLPSPIEAGNHVGAKEADNLTQRLVYFQRQACARKIQRCAKEYMGGMSFDGDVVKHDSHYLPAEQYRRRDSQHAAAVVLQSAWRCHRAQLMASASLLQSWWLKCVFQSSVTKNRILLMKIGLQGLSRAIGRVDSWWITERIQIGNDSIHVEWKREMGIHFREGGIPKLESCAVCLKSNAKRARFSDKWNNHKLAILMVKATLERALRRDQENLANISAILIQSWTRMMTARSRYLRQVDACRFLQLKFRHMHRQRKHAFSIDTDPALILEKSLDGHPLKNTSHLSLRNQPCGVQQSRASFHPRPFNSYGSMQETAVVSLQCCARHFLIANRLERRRLHAVLIQTAIRRFLAYRTFRAKQLAANLLHDVKERIISDRDEQWKIHNTVIIQAFWRKRQARIAFRRAIEAAVRIQTWERRRSVGASYKRLVRGTVLLQSLARAVIQRHQLDIDRRCSTLIQSVWRGSQRRKVLQTRHACAIMIQALLRGRRCRKAYVVQRRRQRVSEAAVLIQSNWRRSQARSSFNSAKSSAVVIQSWERRRAVYTSYNRLARGVVVLQSLARALIQQRQCGIECRSATLIQSVWRGSVSRTELQTQHVCAIMIQALLRGRRCRKAYITHRRRQRVSEAAVMIQSNWRRSQARSGFTSAKSSAVVIQSWERRRAARACYERLARGIVVLQSLARDVIRRRQFDVECRSATLIQSVWRGSESRTELQTQHVCAIMIQALLRGRRCRKAYVVRRRRQRVSEAAVMVQNNWRRSQARSGFKLAKSSAAVIQSWERRRAVYSSYERLVRGIVVLQSLARALIQRRQSGIECRSATLIQSVWRGSERRTEFQTQHVCAVLLQTFLRGRLCRKAYVARKRRQRVSEAAAMIQNNWRRSQARSGFKLANSSAAVIQSWERRRAVYSSYERLVRGIVVLQSLARALIQRRQSGIERRCATLIQSVWRGSESRKELQTQHVCAIMIQAFHRERRCRKAYVARRRMQRVSEAAVLIQRNCRRTQARSTFKLVKSSAVVIQSWERRRAVYASYKRLARGIVVLQSLARSFIRRRQLDIERRSATLIQNVWRGSESRRELQTQHVCAVMIQAMIRERRCRKAYVARRRRQMASEAAILIQRNWRRTQARANFKLVQSSAVVIQSWERRRAVYSSYKKLARGIVVLQSLARSFILQRHLDIEGSSATLLQSVWRGSESRKELQTQRVCAVMIQAMLRERRCRKAYITHRRTQRVSEAAVMIQSFWRRSQVPTSFKSAKSSAVAIQSWERRRAVYASYKKLARGIIILQSLTRAFIRQRHLDIDVRSATLIQRVWRGSESRKELQRQHVCAVMVQAMIRERRCRTAYVARRRTQVVSEAAILIQSNWRLSQARANFKLAKSSAVEIQTRERLGVLLQSLFRGAVQRRRFTEILVATTMLQALARGRASLLSYTRIRQCCLRLQAWFRRALVQRHIRAQSRAAMLLQSVWRGSLARLFVNTMRIGVIMIQAVVRGALTRQRLLSAPEGSKWNDEVELVFGPESATLCSPNDASEPAYILIGKLQARIRTFLAQRRYERMCESAKLIQKAYATWKMEAALLDVESSVVLLHRSVRGQLSHSAMRFALDHVNDSFRSAVLSFFIRIMAEESSDSIQITSAWAEAVRMATASACILIQRATRRYLAVRAMAEVRHAAIEIQRMWRGESVRPLLRWKHVLSRVVQNEVRCFLCVKAYRTCRKGIVSLQSIARGRICRARLARLVHEPRTIQRRQQKFNRMGPEKELQAVTREEAAVLAKAKEAAQENVARLLIECEPVVSKGSDPCISRLVQRVKLARARAGLSSHGQFDSEKPVAKGADLLESVHKKSMEGADPYTRACSVDFSRDPVLESKTVAETPQEVFDAGGAVLCHANRDKKVLRGSQADHNHSRSRHSVTVVDGPDSSASDSTLVARAALRQQSAFAPSPKAKGIAAVNVPAQPANGEKSQEDMMHLAMEAQRLIQDARRSRSASRRKPNAMDRSTKGTIESPSAKGTATVNVPACSVNGGKSHEDTIHLATEAQRLIQDDRQSRSTARRNLNATDSSTNGTVKRKAAEGSSNRGGDQLSKGVVKGSEDEWAWASEW